MEAGYHVATVDLAAECVTWRKARLRYTVQRTGDAIDWDSTLIRALRSHMEMSQAELADTLGVRQQTVSEWETGAYAPTRASAKHLTLVAERAGFLYGDEGEVTAPVDELLSHLCLGRHQRRAIGTQTGQLSF